MADDTRRILWTAPLDPTLDEFLNAIGRESERLVGESRRPNGLWEEVGGLAVCIDDGYWANVLLLRGDVDLWRQLWQIDDGAVTNERMHRFRRESSRLRIRWAVVIPLSCYLLLMAYPLARRIRGRVLRRTPAAAAEVAGQE